MKQELSAQLQTSKWTLGPTTEHLPDLRGWRPGRGPQHLGAPSAGTPCREAGSGARSRAGRRGRWEGVVMGRPHRGHQPEDPSRGSGRWTRRPQGWAVVDPGGRRSRARTSQARAVTAAFPLAPARAAPGPWGRAATRV